MTATSRYSDIATEGSIMDESGSGARSGEYETRHLTMAAARPRGDCGPRSTAAPLALVAALALLVSTACAAVAGPGSTPAALSPGLVAIDHAGLHPEDVEWGAERSRFLVSSITTGSISAVGDDGTTTVLAAGKPPVATVGR